MKIIRSGSLPSVRGPEAWFTGAVRIDAPFQATEPASVGGATVTFEPGARTAWHTHPLGQTLIVTQGRGWLQAWGEEAEILNQGDIAWIPPGVKHWHGASAQTAMTHLAIAEAVNGSPVTWLRPSASRRWRSLPPQMRFAARNRRFLQNAPAAPRLLSRPAG